jgi:DNA-binding transcriptional regulator GbsR (MarR family)
MTLVVTPAMGTIINHIGGLGPRWGLGRETCAVHALLYLAGRSLSLKEIGSALDMDEKVLALAVVDLVDWRMAHVATDGRLSTSDEPWNLLFAAMEERRRRELEPALAAFQSALGTAAADGTPPLVQQRIRGLHDLVCDLSVLGKQAGRLSSRTLASMTGIAGRLLRTIGPSR